jgi:hypothetical protein
LQAGQLIFQNIDKPYFLQIDLYKAMTNLTLGETGLKKKKTGKKIE